MKRQLLAGLAWAAVATPGFAVPASTAGPLTGTWRFVYSCAGATGIYVELCKTQPPDAFELWVVQSGDTVCGGYEVTTQLGNHVDDGDLSDWKFTPISDRTFHVDFHLSGTIGEAVVHLAGSRMHWRELSEQPDPQADPTALTFSPPKKATLVKQPAVQGRGTPTC